jgi:hypothetical protein
MSTSLFSHRYYELIRTAADIRLVDRHSDHSNQLTPKTVLSRASSTSVCDVALRPRRGDIGQQFFEPVHRHGLYQMVIES